ncbi:MAG: hypothetical protein BZY81_04980 [SAR202 cluster bacterium Io17-Chloro-G4]|nr:MAG: hypothetical protein BZY81_04980 [SAR202 cluster bacterium Io17-Chloro-G4]
MVTQGFSDNNRQFEAAVARGDAAGCAAVYADGGKVMAPDTPMITGREAIQGYWQAILDMGAKGVSLRTLDLDEMGDTAVERGAATLDIQIEGGGIVQAEAKFIVVWKRQADGAWKWDTDCFNFDAPLG